VTSITNVYKFTAPIFCKKFALSKESQITFELATTIELKFNLLSGIGKNPFVGKFPTPNPTLTLILFPSRTKVAALVNL
jgi:hypothetical protein